jgi:D-xylose transport system permease protein
MSDPSTDVVEETPSEVPADLLDERLVHEKGVVGALQAFAHRVRGGDLGSLPVIIGLVVISLVFYVQDATFLSSRTLVNITLFAAPIGVISLGVVLVLLLGEIDLSVGSVSGLAASVMAVMQVYHSQSLLVSMAAGIGTGLVIGIAYGLLYTRVGVPSFVITLAGLLGFLGLQLVVLGRNGTVNLPQDSGLIEFTRQSFLSPVVSYVLVAVVAALYGLTQLARIRRRNAAGLSAPSYALTGIKVGLLLVGLGYLTYYLNIDRGIGYLPLLFVVLVVLMDLVLRRTRWGRHVFAVGGNEEAARRSGIKVNRVYVSVFALTGMFSALGGLLAAGQLTSVSQASGGTDTNLTAIAAAVIGGTSLFGGKGRVVDAIIGGTVVAVIANGMGLMNQPASRQYIVTGLVLLVAASVDAISRRRSTASGR